MDTPVFVKLVHPDISSQRKDGQYIESDAMLSSEAAPEYDKSKMVRGGDCKKKKKI